MVHLTPGQAHDLKITFKDLIIELIEAIGRNDAKKDINTLSKTHKYLNDEDLLVIEAYLNEIKFGSSILPSSSNQTQTSQNDLNQTGRHQTVDEPTVTPNQVFNKLLDKKTLKLSNNKSEAKVLFNLALLMKKPIASSYVKQYKFNSKEHQGHLEEISTMFTLNVQLFNPNDESEAIGNLKIKLHKEKKEKAALLENIKELELKSSNSSNVKQEEIYKEEIAKLKNELVTRDTKLSATKLLADQRQKNASLLETQIHDLQKQIDIKDVEIAQLKTRISHLELPYKKGFFNLQFPLIPPVPANQSTPRKRNRSNSNITLGEAAKSLLLYVATIFNLDLDSKMFTGILKPKFDLKTKLNDILKVRKINPPNPSEKDRAFIESIIWFIRRQTNNDNLDTTTHDGYTLLHIATYFGDKKTVERLLNNSADPTIKMVNTSNFDALALAIYQGQEHLIEILYDRTLKKHQNTTTFLTKTKHYDSKQLTMFDLAVKYGSKTFLKKALPSLNLTPTQYSSSIVWAITDRNDVELLILLLFDAQQKNVELKLNETITIVDNMEMLKVLLFYGAYITPSTTSTLINQTDIITSNLHFAVALDDINLTQKFAGDPRVHSELNLTQCFYMALIKNNFHIAAFLVDQICLNRYPIRFAALTKIILRDEAFLKAFFEIFINKPFWDNFSEDEICSLISQIKNMHCEAGLFKILEKNSHFERYLNQNELVILKKLIINKDITDEDILPKLTSIPPQLLAYLEGDQPILALAITHNRLLIVEKLLELNKVNPNDLLADCETALHLAVKSRQHEIIKLLLQHGADVTSMSLIGMPLVYALNSEYVDELAIKILTDPQYTHDSKIIESLRYCLSQYVKLNDKNSIHILIKNCSKDLVEQACSIEIMTLVIARRRLEVLSSLMELDLNWHAKNKFGISMLDLAFYVNDSSMLNILHKKYVQSDLFLSVQKGHYTLSSDEEKYLMALDSGDSKTVQEIISQFQQWAIHANWIFRTRDMSALMIAALRGDKNIVQFLLKSGAKADQKNSRNLDASDFAAMSDYFEVTTQFTKDNGLDGLETYLGLPNMDKDDDFFSHLGLLSTPKRKVSPLNHEIVSEDFEDSNKRSKSVQQ